MDADTLTLARLLTTAALLAATTEYIELIKRRAVRTAHARERAMFEEQGLNGLVRVFLAGAGKPRRRSNSEWGTGAEPDLRWVRNPASEPSSSAGPGRDR
jgi:hypothetical protein